MNTGTIRLRFLPRKNRHMKKNFPASFVPLLASACSFLLFPACSGPAEKIDQPGTDSLQASTFLFLSDIHLNTFDSATEYGEDTGLQLWKNFLAKADSILSATDAPQFIIYTGDLPAHYPCDSSCYLAPGDRETHNANLKAILEGLRALADKCKKPLFYLPGNNDGLAGDYYSFADEKQQTPFSLVPDGKNPFPALNMQPGNKAPCMVDNPHPAMGYYSAKPVEGLRLVALNTVIFSRNFDAVDGTAPDADREEEMEWLAAQLKDASAKNEKVYIAMHIPPGLDAYSGKSMWTDKPLKNGTLLNNFLALTTKYRSSIAGILYGHTHMDELRRLYDTTGTTVTEVALCCPGVTPQHNNNPGFKVVSYQPQSKELLDFTTYYTRPQNAYWGAGTYTFSSAFGCGKTCHLFETFGAMPLAKAAACMDSIFTVKNGPAGYDISRGIEVKPGQ